MTMSEKNGLELPAALEGLRELAYNLRWSWDPPTASVFEQLDPARWAQTHRNPVRLLLETDPIRLQAAARSERYLAELGAVLHDFRAYLGSQETWYRQRHGGVRGLRIAYFSAEFALTECLRIFSGGLGVLAGDHLKSASDLGIPLVAVGLFYKEGYFAQQVDEHGRQIDVYLPADPTLLPLTLETRFGERLLVNVPFLDHQLFAQIWRADVGRVPLYLLDTDIPENRVEDRRITDRLYGGDNEHRLRQEIVLGIGGRRALAALGIVPTVLHLNEGHAAFAAVERVRQLTRDHGSFAAEAQRLTGGVVFTTHTPVPAGHDFFPSAMMERYLGGYIWETREPWQRFLSLGRHDPHDVDEPFNMTLLALRLSSRRNGVSRLHGEVSRKMWRGVWPGLAEEDVPIGHVTNGVHLATWVAPDMAKLYASRLGADWADVSDEFHWHRVDEIPRAELWQARCQLRQKLVTAVRQRLAVQVERRGEHPGWTQKALDPNALTIVFARRFATYKRATLLLTQPDRLMALLRQYPVQFIFAGKAHPRDEAGKDFLRRIFEFAAQPEVRERFIFLEEYDPELARLLTGSADVWLNVPRRPYEASGTSGMKAAANGALNLSVPDGWWAEAWASHNRLPNPPGWAIESTPEHADAQDQADAEALYRLLEQDVVPLFLERDADDLPVEWCERVRSCLRQIVPFFNTHRMVAEYLETMYLPAHEHTTRAFANL
ncbi:MAG TPA: alpha-glucan family phosphorylase, partial [Longimicrobiales bacterium]|nr:alpha-glucan family phosphorylase [Longimicrobiales bacterium]